MSAITQINIEQMVVAALTLAAAGIAGFWLKDIPMRLFGFIKRQCTTTIDITSAHNSFYTLMKFLEYNYSEKNFRTFKLTNGKSGYDDVATVGIGYGGHFIKYKNLFMYVRLEKEDSHGTDIDKETITITKLGRSRKQFDKFFKVISSDRHIENNIQIYRLQHHWRPMNQIPKRAMDTVFLEESKKSTIFKTIDDFIHAEQWYMDNGIPYHLGILLYGSPGTGKSSMIKAIASYTDYDIYYLSVSSLSRLEDSMEAMPRGAIIVIEDIDCEKVLHTRTVSGSQAEPPRTAKSSNDILSFVNFSDVLNAIDGVCSSHGRILIATTNHIEKLDPALIRPGRIDLKVEIGYVNTEIFNQFARRFFRKEICANFQIKPRITCAELQNLLLQQKSYNDILEYVQQSEKPLGGSL